MTSWAERRRAAEKSLRPGHTAEGLDALRQATQDYIQTAAPLQTRAISVRERLYELHGRALGHLIGRLNRLRRAHKISEASSWYLYAIGTILVLAGNWLKVTT